VSELFALHEVHEFFLFAFDHPVAVLLAGEGALAYFLAALSHGFWNCRRGFGLGHAKLNLSDHEKRHIISCDDH
jgi:hypothetical protein